ncbi:glycoprotein-N-acetylgalactosamine 3-beta-galactosyltransferase 1-like isoform X1 [Dermacentor albipictus]|uniref:glycoprotein-N-acetylgalactosamine 3-beta-galactosyltransferase 1-like isoform X1 n=2 Tax=Dermacentor albipictus TaxID=60249 RepID=UPI0038FD2FFF
MESDVDSEGLALRVCVLGQTSMARRDAPADRTAAPGRRRRVAQAGACRSAAVFAAGLSVGLALTCWLPQARPVHGASGQRPGPRRQRAVPPWGIPRTPILYDLNSSDHCGASSCNWVSHDLLRKRVHLLCWVLTNPNNTVTKARHVAATWGRRCDRLLFMSTARSHEEELRPSVVLNLSVAERRNALWAKTKASLVELYNGHLGDYDWFYKADDDTYAIVENLRFFLLGKDPSQPLYFGYPFRVLVPKGYMSGGAGYVLSREALRRLVEQGMMQGQCRADGAGSEDAELGRCLTRVGVPVSDTRDALGRNRFFPLRIDHYFWPDLLPLHWWIWRYAMHPIRPGWNCCSDTAVAFHYTPPDRMYVFEYFVYHVRLLGGLDQRVYPRRPPLPELIP